MGAREMHPSFTVHVGNVFFALALYLTVAERVVVAVLIGLLGVGFRVGKGGALHRGRHYDYRGHWRSWDAWDGYYRAHPHWRRHGHYYHDGGHLMFRYCDPDADGCFFFSIGH